jgi:hypothetical protein
MSDQGAKRRGVLDTTRLNPKLCPERKCPPPSRASSSCLTLAFSIISAIVGGSSTPPSGECANTVGAISKPDVDDAPFDSPNARAP